MTLLLALACTNPEAVDDTFTDSIDIADTQDSGDTGETGDTGRQDFVCGELTEPEVPGSISARSLSSTTTWSLAFDDLAEESGLTDCSYTRDFVGLEFLDQPYLCPDCQVIVAGYATMTQGADCFVQISESEGSREEWWGLSADGQLFRGGTPNLRLSTPTDQAFEGDLSGGTFSWRSVNELSAGGELDLSAVGEMTIASTDTLLPDPWAARQSPYAGGWPQESDGLEEVSWELAVGQKFPNARETDQCGDSVDLWDQAGRYLIVDVSQHNCGPCQVMATDFAALDEGLGADGIQIDMVTYMGNGLSDPLTPPSQEIVDEWQERFGTHGPLFLDRGFAYNTLHDFVEQQSDKDFGFPAWVVLGPDMEVLHGQIGYGSYDDVQAMIREHAASE